MAHHSVIRIALPLIIAAVSASSSTAQEDQSFHLALPLDCKFGETCFIQQYFDHDPTTGVKDYRCGTMSYDGHDGVDLRVPTMAAQRQGVLVLAAASGIVKAIRDGVADVNVRALGFDRIADVNVRALGFDRIAGIECGNGVLIEHDGGWETQYCHLARGSVLVRPGQHVETGTSLGLVGLSGQTEFPHLHFSVGHNGIMVDPFAAGATDACDVAHPLWLAAAAAALAYHSPSLINFGFTAEVVSMGDVELGRTDIMHPTPDSPVLIAFVRAIGLKAADVQSFTLKGPDGHVLAYSESPPLAGNMAEQFAYVGKRRSAAQWPRGTYEADFEIRRDGAAALSRRFSFDLK